MSDFPPIYSLLLFALVITAGVYDIRWRRIPNWLTGSGILLGLALNALLFGWRGLGAAGAGFGLAGVIYFLLYLVRGMGAGDVKLMAAIGALVGPGAWFQIFILTSLAGAAFALILVIAKGRLRKTFWNVAFILRQFLSLRAPYVDREDLDVRSDKAMRMPHGAVIALGTLGVMAVRSIAG